MGEFIELHELLATGRNADAALALRAGVRLLFSEFAERANAWRTVFATMPGEKIALFFEDSAAFACALFGAWHAGKQAVLPADVLPETLRRLSTICAGCAGDFPADAPLSRVSASASPDAAQDAAQWQTLDPERIALFVFTSGSTGEPTLVPKRLSQLSAEVRALESTFGSRLGEATVYATVTHQHMYGLPFRLLWPLAAGRAFVAERWTFPEDMARGLVNGACALIASPAHLKRLPQTLDWRGARNHLRAVFSAGGPLPDEALPLCDHAFGQVPVEIYGSTETGAVAWRQRAEETDAPWHALPGMALSIEGDTLRMAASWLQESGWHSASDKVQAQGDGFALLGRADRIVKIEEKRISLQAVERALLESGLLMEARVVPLPGERVRLGVAAVPNAEGWNLHDTQGRKALADALRSQLACSIETIALPRHWRFTWALPVNAAGKTPESALLPLFDPRRPPVRLLERTAESAKLRIEITASLPFFDGHFPQAKILPGVAQLDITIRFARELFALPPDFAGAENLKFLDWIGTDSMIELELVKQEDIIVFRIDSTKGRHASGRLRFSSCQFESVQPASSRPASGASSR